ncbi:MAG: cysteine--tRNA ligase [Elusimicrobia bacterium]|nr:cysteine--tRNA ligase [Elusimicrobiota bacterium]
MDIYLTNTLSRSLERFEPLHTGKAGLYVCGITPYDSPHLGHARAYVTFDLLRRLLEAVGYDVRHVQNFTDMDDKILARAKERGVSPFYLTGLYMDEYFEAMDRLDVKRAKSYPRVTQHVDAIIKMIARLIERGYAYAPGNGDVYFSVSKFSSYGKLSKRKTEDLLAGARVEISSVKRDPLDFALWKGSKGDAVEWDSPWGRGRPGWHIECSVMSSAYLGQPFDIHGGGQDLIFPHHENEIAQSEAAHDAAFARYFVHNGFVTVNKEKMSKSLGNFFTLKEIYEKFSPRVVRYYLISEYYRSPIDFSDQSLKEASSALGRIQEAVDLLEFLMERLNAGPVEPSSGDVSRKAMALMAQDIHSPSALAAVQDWASAVFDHFKKKKFDARSAKIFLADGQWTLLNLLGLPPEGAGSAPPEAKNLLAEREECRKNKNFSRADALRERLLKEFFLIIEDTPYGARLKDSIRGSGVRG